MRWAGERKVGEDSQAPGLEYRCAGNAGDNFRLKENPNQGKGYEDAPEKKHGTDKGADLSGEAT